METLNEKGFVFLGARDHKPYLCAMWNDTPWLFYWHCENHWVSLQKVTQANIWMMPKNLSEKEQNLYHDLHKKWEYNQSDNKQKDTE